MSIAAAGYSAIAHRLALGIEPIDALRGQRALAPLAVACDAPAEDGLHPRFDRHPSNRFVLRYDATLANGGTVDLRLFAARGPVYALGNDTRRYVPRRLRIALPTLAVAEQRSPLARVCRPRLFPGAAHLVSDLASGVRARVPRAQIYQALQWLQDEWGFDMLVDITCVDYLHYRDATERFAVVYQLCNTRDNQRLTVRVLLSEPDLAIPSVTSLWESANWLEREVFDMFGIYFEGHPDLRRILLPPEFTSYPLRKDYPLQGRGERHNFTALTREGG